MGGSETNFKSLPAVRKVVEARAEIGLAKLPSVEQKRLLLLCANKRLRK